RVGRAEGVDTIGRKVNDEGLGTAAVCNDRRSCRHALGLEPRHVMSRREQAAEAEQHPYPESRFHWRNRNPVKGAQYAAAGLRAAVNEITYSHAARRVTRLRGPPNRPRGTPRTTAPERPRDGLPARATLAPRSRGAERPRRRASARGSTPGGL